MYASLAEEPTIYSKMNYLFHTIVREGQSKESYGIGDTDEDSWNFIFNFLLTRWDCRFPLPFVEIIILEYNAYAIEMVNWW